MKKQLLVIALFSMILFINASEKITSLLLVVSGPEPSLPALAMDYSIPDLPPHFNNDSIELGYTSTAFPFMFNQNTKDINDDKATLGRVLFYDKLLSSNENISCASCHLQELSFSDGKSFSDGLNEPTQRNSLHLNDLAWDSQRFFSWDMEMETLSDMISLPLQDENELGIDMEEVIDKMFNTSYYPSLFQIAYQYPLASEEKIIECLVHFIKSMHTFNSRLDQQAKVDFEGFTQKEQYGKDLFRDKCARCHTQGSFYYPSERTNFNGLPADPDDLGAGEWNPEFEGLFRVPTLRNVELTAPYMHDGRHSTLEQVVKHYSDSLVLRNDQFSTLLPFGGFAFNDREEEALVAFMKTFTDLSFTTNEKWSDPFKSATTTDDLDNEINITLAPNPMNSYATISIENEKSEEIAITIYTQNGQIVCQETFNGTSYIIEKDRLNAGIYFINLQMGSKVSTKKLIVN